MGEVIEPHDAADDAVSTIVASQSKTRGESPEGRSGAYRTSAMVGHRESHVSSSSVHRNLSALHCHLS